MSGAGALEGAALVLGGSASGAGVAAEFALFAPDRVLRVAAERRVFHVAAERRVFSIARETRVFKVLQEAA